MCRPALGTHCTNFLEGANYVTDQNKQFILSGTVGETWVIDINKLANTYTFADGTPITPETLSKKCDVTGLINWTKIKTRSNVTPNWAILIPKSIQNFPVQASWGDTLYANRPGISHGHGDFLLCPDDGMGHPNLNDVWVVNGKVFPTTYDLHSFSDLFQSCKYQNNTPVPQHKFVNNSTTMTKNKAAMTNMYKYASKYKSTYGFDNIELKLEENTADKWLVIIASNEATNKIAIISRLDTSDRDRAVLETFNTDNDLTAGKSFTYSDRIAVQGIFSKLSKFFKNPTANTILDID